MTATAPAPKIRPKDFLGFDQLLNDEERDIRDTVRAFVNDRVLPNVGEWFEEARIPLELASELGKIGVLGMHLEGYGCAGASATAYGLACMELERATAGYEASSRCRALWPCSPSTTGARRSRSRSGCRRWPPAKRSAASA